MTTLPRKFDNLPSKISIVGSPNNNREFSFEQEIDYMLYDIPSQANFLWNYQIKKMYIRYFLWQFAGKGKSEDPFVANVGATSNEDGVDWRQFGLPIALIMGLIGFGYHFRKNKKDAFSLLVLFLMTGIAIIFYLNQDAPQPRERDYAYVASFMTFSIWIGLGVYAFTNFITESLLEKSIKLKASYLMIVLFILFMPCRMLIANYHEHDRTGNYIAWDMAYNMLQTCEPNSILFTNGDNDTFPLWYLQEVEKIRTDVIVANLSLLNTPWYVDQLKERYKDKAFIKMSYQEIQNLDFKRWESKTISINAPKDENNELGKIEWELKPTYLDVALRIQDLMVLRIINDNNWQRPIYFGVTVAPTSMLNLDDYLQMEGLAYRLVNNSNEVINQNKMSDNLLTFVGENSWFLDYDSNKNNSVNKSFSKDYQRGYIYRNLANEDVYVDPQLGRLVQNYRTGFVRLSISHYLDKNFQKAESTLLKMEEIMPSSVIPIPSKQLQYQIAQVYNGVGNQDQMKYHMKELVERKDLLLDKNDKLLKDNDERMIFFTKGVIETVKKLNWSPDVIHLHGWFTSLFPLYLNTYYKDEPIFANNKIVTSVYAKDFEGVVSSQFHKKVSFDDIPEELIEPLRNADFENLQHLSLNFSDGYVIADQETPKSIENYSNYKQIPGLSFEESQKDDALVSLYTNHILK
mgnify:CR=1 FL=1